MKGSGVLASLIFVTVGAFLYCQWNDADLSRADQQSVAKDTQKLPTISSARDFPEGVGTPSVECGECHQAIYREYAYGFGIDTVPQPRSEEFLSLPGRVLTSGPAHSISGTRPDPPHGFGTETGHSSCGACHYPEPFSLTDSHDTGIKQPRQTLHAKKELGITCASCHLTPEGQIRGPYGAKAPHATIKEPKMQTADMCEHCHSSNKSVPNKQFQTFLEWRDDFHRQKLGTQQCQDCHMARTLRKTAEDQDVPIRAVARHLWTGGHSPQGISNALSIAVVTEKRSSSALTFHLINVGAGHSVPTGSSRRALHLKADVVDNEGAVVAKRDWMFAPWYGDRPDDKAFLQEDKNRPDAALAMKADEQGPHEDIIRAGEERVLSWNPELPSGEFEIRVKLIYDLNRYDPKSEKERMTIFHKILPIRVK